MPTETGLAFDPSWTSYPPGMSAEDGDLYYRWREKYLDGVEKLYFNVRVGQGRPCGDMPDPEMRRMWLRNTQKRIDMIAQYQDHIEIVEFRHIANPNAIGRLLCYEHCYMEDPVLGEDYTLTLVTDVYDLDVDKLAKKFGIEYIVL